MASPTQNPLLGLAPNAFGGSPANALMPPSPYDVTPAQGMQANAQAVGNYLAQQRAQSAAMGLMDPNTGLPTRAGLMNAAGQYGNALMMGTTEPGAPPVNGLLAYHGSPHSFDRFNLDKIGTGEGNQAYGHGLYFAGNEAVAKSYRDGLTRTISVDGKPLLDSAKRVGTTGNPNIDDLLLMHDGDVGAAIADVHQEMNSLPQGHPALDEYSNELAQLHALQGKVNTDSAGHMYQVQINANPEHFLDWDKPISEQHPVVQDALAQHLEPHRQQLVNDFLPSWRDPTPDEVTDVNNQATASIGAMRGGQAYTKIGAYDPVAATQALQASGIPGVKYLDQGSRGGEANTDASHNYVVFDDNAINVLKKYGIAGLGIGGAAATQSQVAPSSDYAGQNAAAPAATPQY